MPKLTSSNHIPMAGGLPLDQDVADQAADWLTLLMSGEATENTQRGLQAWREQSPDNERAWKHVESVTGRLTGVDPHAGYRALSPYADLPSPNRRKVLSLLLWGGAIGATAAVATRTPTWQTAVADYHTATGDQRLVSLGDGTRVLLNTASAIDVRFDARERLLRLIAGEIRIVTGHADRAGQSDLRPFVVETDEGRVQALGTRFTVRQEDGYTVVGVEESAVNITPTNAPDAALRLPQQQRASFTRNGIRDKTPLQDRDVAWTRGQLIADNQRLGDFLKELARYRTGIVRCDPSAAELRFSGVFPLTDTDQILNTLPSVLPVVIRLRTRYWVTVEQKSA